MTSPSFGPPTKSLETTTLERHLLDRQRAARAATGDFSGLFYQIALAAKIIASKVTKAGLANVIGLTGDKNVQGEEVQKLDVFANNTLIRCVSGGGHVCVMGSEEIEEPIAVPEGQAIGKYVLQFDPLDGSGNIDINASIGTIFSIHHRKTKRGPGTLDDCLQPGRDIVAAGYVVYGSSTMLVYAAGDRVDGFTFDPAIGEFFLSHADIQIPERGNIYSINEGNYHKWDQEVRDWVDWIKTPGKTKEAYKARYIGAVVADFHRTLLRGGVFAYPRDDKNTNGKLRLLYEAAPLAYICEAAGGESSTGSMSVLDVQPNTLHQRTPLIVGSRFDVQDALRFVTAN